ncbi:MAG: GNAT family N-acetyltransferase [Rhizobiaceae bacterium]
MADAETEDLLVTPRLRLRMWEPGDPPYVKRLHADPVTNRYLSQKPDPWSDKKVARRLAGWQDEFAADGLTKFKLLRRSDGVFLGRAGFSRLHGSGEFELGYSILRSEWGKGYASEIAAALAQWFFTLGKGDHFVAFAHVDNIASQKVLEKAGMRFERTGPYHDMPFRFYRMERGDLADQPSLP